MKYFVIVGSLVLVGIVLFLDVFKHFINPDYWVALGIVPIVLLANLLLGIYHNLSIWYKLTDKTRYGMYFSIIGAFVTIVFNVVMLPIIGFMASAWATLAAYGLMVLVSYIVGKKLYPIPYEVGKILGYLLAGSLIVLFSFRIQPNWIQSIVLLLLYASVIYILERKELRKYF